MRKLIPLDGAPRAHPQSDPTSTVIDLDRVQLAPSVMTAWRQAFAAALPRLRGLPPDAIPNEQDRVWSNNRLQIFVTLPRNRGEVTLDVALGAWAWRPGGAGW